MINSMMWGKVYGELSIMYECRCHSEKQMASRELINALSQGHS